MDLGFPTIVYEEGKSFSEWGQSHGESYRDAIHEVAAIRRELMLQKSPTLEDSLDSLAAEQWKVTKEFAPDIWQELEGIRQGSGLSITDIVILNNYTDFRDIELPEEGCSVAYIYHSGRALAGQTWDMHRSAKDYVCLIQMPATDRYPASLALSLVGSVGMVGYNQHRLMVGVNNLNTRNAKAGILWPAVIRHALLGRSYQDARRRLTDAPIAGGRNYLLASPSRGECLEVMPGSRVVVGGIEAPYEGQIFHTNHCLSAPLRQHENQSSLSSTTHDRYRLLDEKIHAVCDLESMEALFSDHDEYPRSICSHYESGTQDPAFTCAAVAADLYLGEFAFWRGCTVYDDNFREYRFKLKGERFVS